MRSVPPAEFEREAAALSPSKSFSNLRTESMVQPVSRQIAVKGKRNRLILLAPRVLAVAMRLSSRHGFDLPPTRMLHHRLPFRQGFSFAAGGRGKESDFAPGRLSITDRTRQDFKIGKSSLSR